MSITTNLFERELVAHLLEKYDSLVEIYPPKRRILGLNPSRFEEAVKMGSQKRERADISMARLT